MPLDFPNREHGSEEYYTKEKGIKATFESYKNSIRNEIRDRNVGEENSSRPSYEIKLEKFKGYKSKIVIYTFHSEFEKCHQKNVKKKLLPDYLKNNYIEGDALSLVKGIDNLDDIWKRLKEAYGDIELLLENKLHEIVKMGEIWKIREREKSVCALSLLIFVMLELRTLAEKHNIENELYYGGSIQKVYKVLGYAYTNRFIGKYCELKPSKKDCWKQLVDFLKKEVKFQEEIILNNRLFQEEDKTSVVRKKSYEGEKKNHTTVILTMKKS